MNATSARRVFAGAVFLLLAALACPAALAQPAALEFRNQKDDKPFNRSAIVTSDKFNYWDFQFDKLVNDSVGGNFKQIVFDFNECFGGGMIDELLARNYAPAAYTSAARHNQVSLARSEDLISGVDPNFPNQIRRVESTYNVRWAPAAGGANPAMQSDAATTARAQDRFGPFQIAATRADLRFAVAGVPPTDPQYTSSGAPGNALQLHRGDQGTKYRAILFGGSTQLDFGPALKVGNLPNQGILNYQFGNLAVNYNTLLRMRDNLLAAGFTDDEMYIMYPGGHVRDGNNKPTGKIYNGGPAMPDWIDAGTRYNDLTAAWATWMKGQTDQNTQIFYWSSWGHGNALPDAKAQANAKNQKIPKAGLGVKFSMDTDLATTMLDVFAAYNGDPAAPDGGNPLPYFTVETSVLVPQFSVTLNNAPLALRDFSPDPNVAGAYRYKFDLSLSDLAMLKSPDEDTIVVNYDFGGSDGGLYDQFADFITLMGPTPGDFANGAGLAAVPEPAAVALLAAAILAARCSARRAAKRRRAMAG